APFRCEMRASTRTERSEERVLAEYDPVPDHSDCVAIQERNRADRVSAGFDLPMGKGGPDQVSLRLRTAPVSPIPHEPVERFQERAFERYADSSNGHRRPRVPQDATATRRTRSGRA